jgi:hypothetical protein
MEWNGLDVVATHGRNFIGQRSIVLAGVPKPLMKGVALVSQKVLQFFPSLCSDVHVVGRKKKVEA